MEIYLTKNFKVDVNQSGTIFWENGEEKRHRSQLGTPLPQAVVAGHLPKNVTQTSTPRPTIRQRFKY